VGSEENSKQSEKFTFSVIKSAILIIHTHTHADTHTHTHTDR